MNIHTKIIDGLKNNTNVFHIIFKDTETFWEECYWLITYIMYLLTDESEGEIPLIPNVFYIF